MCSFSIWILKTSAFILLFRTMWAPLWLYSTAPFHIYLCCVSILFSEWKINPHVNHPKINCARDNSAALFPSLPASPHNSLSVSGAEREDHRGLLSASPAPWSQTLSQRNKVEDGRWSQAPTVLLCHSHRHSPAHAHVSELEIFFQDNYHVFNWNKEKTRPREWDKGSREGNSLFFNFMAISFRWLCIIEQW